MTLSIKHQSCETDKHSCNVGQVLKIYDDRVVSGDDEGKFKVWTTDLKLLSEIDSSCGAILSLAASHDTIYSCTSDQTIQAWDNQTFKKIGVLQSSLFIPQKVFYEPITKVLWVGDSQGRVAKFENGKEVNKFELTEEIWDLFVTADPTLIYTARDRDVLASVIITGKLRSNAVTKATIEGRYPLAVVNDMVCCLDREGRAIQVHDTENLKLIHKIPAGNMILNALCPGVGSTLYTGGYDGDVRLWEITSGKPLGSVAVGSCINDIAPTENGVYVALTDGRVILVGP